MPIYWDLKHVLWKIGNTEEYNILWDFKYSVWVVLQSSWEDKSVAIHALREEFSKLIKLRRSSMTV